MKFKFLLLIAFLFSLPGQIRADYQLVEPLVGKYPILQMNSKIGAVGYLEIVANANEVGYRLLSVKGTPDSVEAATLITPQGETKIEKQGVVIRQNHVLGEAETRIEYEVYDGFIIVNSSECAGSMCLGDKITVSTGKSFGETVDAEDFFIEKEGVYATISAGGLSPKPSTKEVEVLPDEEEGILLAPYCDKDQTFCDPGYNFFKFSETKVFLRNQSPTEDTFDIFLKTDAGIKYYRWSEKGNEIKIKQLDYTLPGGEVICLEHVLSN